MCRLNGMLCRDALAGARAADILTGMVCVEHRACVCRDAPCVHCTHSGDCIAWHVFLACDLSTCQDLPEVPTGLGVPALPGTQDLSVRNRQELLSFSTDKPWDPFRAASRII